MTLPPTRKGRLKRAAVLIVALLFTSAGISAAKAHLRKARTRDSARAHVSSFRTPTPEGQH